MVIIQEIDQDRIDHIGAFVMRNVPRLFDHPIIRLGQKCSDLIADFETNSR